MRCPTCETELAPDGACPRCASARTLVPPTPVLAPSALASVGTNEYPLGLPYSLAQIEQALYYRSLMRTMAGYAINPIYIAAVIIFLSFTQISIIRGIPGFSPWWSSIGVIGLCIGFVMICTNTYLLIAPGPLASLFGAIINIAIGTVLVIGMIVTIAYFRLFNSYVLCIIAVIVAALPVVVGIQFVGIYRSCMTLPHRLPPELLHLVKGWVKELFRAKIANDESVIQFHDYQGFGAVCRIRRMDDEWLLIGGARVELLVRNRDFHLTIGTPHFFNREVTATVEIGTKRVLEGVITTAHYARFQRWRETGDPPASSQSCSALPTGE